MKLGTHIGIGLLMVVLMATPAADARDGPAGPRGLRPAGDRDAVDISHSRILSEPGRRDGGPHFGPVGFRDVRMHPAPGPSERFRDGHRFELHIGGSYRPSPSRVYISSPRVRYVPGLYTSYVWPRGYVLVTWPYTYSVEREYTHYVFVETPKETSSSTVIETGPYGIPLKPAPPKSEEALFDSRLAPMLGGQQKVTASFAAGEEALRNGDFDQAAFAFRQVLLRRPDEAAAHIALSLALVATEDYVGAARTLKQGLGGLEDLSVVRLDPSEAFGPADKYDRIAERLREAAKNDPANQDVQFLLGFHYFASGQFGQAAEVLWAAQDAGQRDLTMMELLLAAERQSRAEAAAKAQKEEQGEAKD